MPTTQSELSARWDRFLKRAGLEDPGGRVFTRLAASYNSGRQYHNLDHIRNCLRELDGVRKVCPDPLSVEAAIWFHDTVYDPDRKDNEWCSAQVATKTLAKMGMAARRIRLVEQLILDTRHQEMPQTRAGRFMVDIDLTSLGQTPRRFNLDGRHIRAEYPHVPDPAFNKGRAALFQRLLDRKSIYATTAFRKRYERQARTNLSRALKRLNLAR